MQGFVRVGGHYVAAFDAVERRILAAAVSDTAELLGVRLQDLPPVRGGTGPTGGADLADVVGSLGWDDETPETPQDPALARLLPSASRDDDALAAEFRRLTEHELRATKIENLRLVWAALRGPAGTLVVPAAGAPRWAAALTDVRLVLASRLGIETDDDAEQVYAAASGEDDGGQEGERGKEQDEVRAALATLYAALTWLQESLVDALLGAPGPPGPDRGV